MPPTPQGPPNHPIARAASTKTALPTMLTLLSKPIEPATVATVTGTSKHPATSFTIAAFSAMYEGAERRAKGYDRACAVVNRGPFKVIVNTQKHLGMSVLGRAIVAGRLLDRYDAILESAVVVRCSAPDLEALAARHGITIEVVDEDEVGAWRLLSRFQNPVDETIRRVLDAAAASSELTRLRPFGDGGIEEPWLFARLQRAAMTHLSGGTATTGRYGIWAMTCRDHVAEALSLLERGESEEARALLVKAANALAAYAEIQRLLDPMGIDRKPGERF